VFRPVDLLDERDEQLIFTSYSALASPEPVNAIASYPFYNLQDPATTLLLSAVRDHPVRLSSALTAQLVSSYPLVHPTTEAYISPHSLTFSKSDSKFLAGSQSLISVFDLSRPGNGPIRSLRTGTRKGIQFDQAGMKMNGIISALTIDPTSGVLAAGTFSRCIGLYGSVGEGDCLGVFSVAGTDADEKVRGQGVTQLIWSPCGRYLYIVERKSDGAMIYDIRKTGQLVGWLQGRHAMTNQRLGVGIVGVTDGDGHEIWAGGIDGVIRVWRNPHRREGGVKPDTTWNGHGGEFEQVCKSGNRMLTLIAAISGTTVHPSGVVLATCSGERRFGDPSPDDETVTTDFSKQHVPLGSLDNTLKLWSV
jgi:telomerase Cajal body protein 1